MRSTALMAVTAAFVCSGPANSQSVGVSGSLGRTGVSVGLGVPVGVSVSTPPLGSVAAPPVTSIVTPPVVTVPPAVGGLTGSALGATGSALGTSGAGAASSSNTAPGAAVAPGNSSGVGSSPAIGASFGSFSAPVSAEPSLPGVPNDLANRGNSNSAVGEGFGSWDIPPIPLPPPLLPSGRVDAASARAASLKPRGGTPLRVVQNCRRAIVAAALPFGVQRVDAASAGSMFRKRGIYVAPVQFRVTYARQGGVETRVAVVSCQLDSNGRVYAAR